MLTKKVKPFILSRFQPLVYKQNKNVHEIQLYTFLSSNRKKRSINSFYNIIVLEPDNRLEEELELDEVQVAQHDRVLD